MEQDIPLPDLGDNLEEFTIAVNNTDGTVPFVSKVRNVLRLITQQFMRPNSFLGPGCIVSTRSSGAVGEGPGADIPLQNSRPEVQDEHEDILQGTIQTKLHEIPLHYINIEQAYCDALLEDKVLMRTLTEKKFDVAVIDLFYSECSISLAYHLK